MRSVREFLLLLFGVFPTSLLHSRLMNTEFHFSSHILTYCYFILGVWGSEWSVDFASSRKTFHKGEKNNDFANVVPSPELYPPEHHLPQGWRICTDNQALTRHTLQAAFLWPTLIFWIRFNVFGVRGKKGGTGEPENQRWNVSLHIFTRKVHVTIWNERSLLWTQLKYCWNTSPCYQKFWEKNHFSRELYFHSVVFWILLLNPGPIPF